ncbi:Erythromycin esterase [Microbacterium azadirachtae]|uniref:Erythromycin esterase n=1 Tax=Microbacterium azadirachtae TaxID=582680 RepID=A0A0F0KR32_9MICO|nr:erythromycin esterase family protein [Microbacterium azadirachtae]KJL23323.1 Erythromycin esterase [Microbacterium azadirachtae]
MHDTEPIYARPLAAPGEPWDTAAVRALIGDARVVLLGEGAHGVDDFARLGDGLFRTLATELGFTAFVRESGFAEGLAVDAWIQGGPGEAEDIARAGITYGFGESEAVRRQLAWMRAENARRRADGADSPDAGARVPLRFWGMDLPGSSTSPVAAVRVCLDRIPAQDGDDALRRITDLGGRTAAAIAWDGLDDAARDRIRDGIAGLIARVERDGDDIARRSAATLDAFLAELAWDGEPGPYPRERLMADTVAGIAGREERLLVLAHNAHVRRDPLHGRPTLGTLLHARLGDALRVIAMTYGHGPVVSFTERSPRPFDWEVAVSERIPAPGTLEHALDPLGDVLVDLRAAPPALRAGITGTAAGAGIDPIADVATAFDAVAHRHRVSLVPGHLDRLRAEFGSGDAGTAPAPRDAGTAPTAEAVR